MAETRDWVSVPGVANRAGTSKPPICQTTTYYCSRLLGIVSTCTASAAQSVLDGHDNGNSQGLGIEGLRTHRKSLCVRSHLPTPHSQSGISPTERRRAFPAPALSPLTPSTKVDSSQMFWHSHASNEVASMYNPYQRFGSPQQQDRLKIQKRQQQNPHFSSHFLRLANRNTFLSLSLILD